MKQFLQILIFLCVATATYAQNPTEAKMAYQMAEEKFDAKQYGEALDYLEKAETALGSTNPPMLFLKVMITNEIVTLIESTEVYNNLEKAIADFDKHKDKNALGEDKLMDVYRIKMDLDKRKTAYEKEANLKKTYEEMVFRLAAEFPKTLVSKNSFWQSVPVSWAKPLSKEERKQYKKEKKTVLDIGSFYYGDIQLKQLFIRFIDYSEKLGYYFIEQLLSKEVNDKKSRKVTVEEICELLGISAQTWQEFTSGDKPLIRKVESEYGDYYSIGTMSQLSIFEKDITGEFKKLSFSIQEYTKVTEYGEVIEIQVSQNNLLND